jgi:hypothetical protein
VHGRERVEEQYEERRLKLSLAEVGREVEEEQHEERAQELEQAHLPRRSFRST